MKPVAAHLQYMYFDNFQILLHTSLRILDISGY